MRLMTDTCSYPGARDEALISYLYGDIDPAARRSFEAHLATCIACRGEVEALQGVRGQLAMWQPPDQSPVASHQSPVSGRPSPVARRPSPVESIPQIARDRWWREVPAWAQVAAALLFVGIAAGIANLDVRYDANGLTVRTGWSKAPAAAPATVASTTTPDVATRADLVALEQQLRSELHAVQVSAHADAPAGRTPTDAEVLRKARALVDESEKRQQTELALRIGEMFRDLNAQRQADLVRIDRNLGLMQNNIGVEVLKQRQQVNYLMRANQRQ
jgi:NaMN:DMB phosphoribosyltransferase